MRGYQRATFALLLLAAHAHCALAKEQSVLRSAEDVRLAQKDLGNDRREFDLVGTVRSFVRRPTEEWTVMLRCGSNDLIFVEQNTPERTATDPGHFGLLDRIRIRGYLYLYQDDVPRLDLGYHTAELVAPGDLTKLPLLAPSEIENPQNDGRLIRICGTVRDAARDDSDPNYIHLAIRDDHGQAQLMVNQPGFLSAKFKHLIGAKIVAAGICSDNRAGLRRHIGQLLAVSGLENITVTKPAGTFANAPDLETIADALPQHISATGNHQAEGTVLAVWGADRFLIQSNNERTIKVKLEDGQLPAINSRVKILGLPITDFYNIDLIHARWATSPRQPRLPRTPLDITSADLLNSENGHPVLKVRNHGKIIRMCGIIRYLPDETHPFSRIQMESGGQIVSVDASALRNSIPHLAIGCQASVTGVCVMEADNWNVNSAEDTNRGFFLVPRTANDIVVLSRPPWWTPGRLLALLGIFAAAFFGVIGWNVSLNRRARAKGKELAAEQLAHVTSELKVNERTRLAVELHDALSQTLTGVSMQIDTAAGFAEGKMPEVSKCLRLASRAIDACRMELRNTLWDLRSAALDESSMDAAIRKTLCQNLAGIDLSVRFNVPRESFSDNTAHAVLKFVRELATNAIRHGKATSLKIAGTVDDGKLLFSVRDNGCGFNPDLAPGISQGHFGLQGITERLERLNGEMKIDSAPGKGAKVTIVLPIPRSGE